MFISNRPRALVLGLALILASATAAGCDDPTASRQPPALTRMVAFAILDPDSTTQPLLVYPADAASALTNLRGTVRQGGAMVETAPMSEHFWGCSDRYGPLSAQPRCVNFEFVPHLGTTYEVSASADGYPTVRATVTVPGDFRLIRASAEGTPPGSGGLDVWWTPSRGAYRYLVALRPTTAPGCLNTKACRRGWYAVTTDTMFAGTVPTDQMDGARGPWSIDVFALDQAAFEYLTTGSSGNLFPVPPMQNVEGGYGAIGAWVHRSLAIGASTGGE